MLSRLRSFMNLVWSPELRPADGVVVAALGLIVVCISWISIVHYGRTHPEIAPFLDRDGVEIWFRAYTRIILPAFVAFLVAGLIARRYRPHSRIFAHAFAQFYFIQAAFFSYLVGHYTDTFAPMALFVGTVCLLPLLGVPFALAGIATFFVLMGATTVAESMGILPYAPFFSGAPYNAGRLSTHWFFWGTFSYSGLFFAALIFVWTTQRLFRATALIRRYVPTQLAQKILAGEHAGEGLPERRKLTLFFSDVVGFTPAADRMEAEDLTALLNEYLSEMAKIADTFDATINQFVGDGIMIFFGAPEATSDQDHAVRAVRMSLAMQRRMAELGENWYAEGIHTPFRIRIGINTGVASVGDFGSEGRTTYSAIGNQTNLTARIQNHCEPGKVLISHTTWALVKDEIACQDRGEIEVKGIHYPVRVYEVLEKASSDAGTA